MKRRHLSQEMSHKPWRLPKCMTTLMSSSSPERLKAVRTAPLAERVSFIDLEIRSWKLMTAFLRVLIEKKKLYDYLPEGELV